MASSSRRASAVFLASILLGGTAVSFLPAMLATRDIRRFCSALPASLTMTDLAARADAAGLRFEKLAPAHALVEHPRSLGRAYCEVRFDDQGRLSSKSAEH